jgi:hypothetical protein
MASACNSTPFQAPSPKPEGEAAKLYDVNPIRALDLVFMIDNSGSMKEEQEKLRKNFPVFIDTLRKIPGGLPDLHIGILSSDVGAGDVFISGNPACNRAGGDKGDFQVKSGCGLDATKGNFIISNSNDTMKNFTGTLDSVFSCMADLGTGGCGFEHQLQSIRVALASNNPVNNGFLRKDAFLAVVMITDEDDCSGEPRNTLYSDPGFDGQTGSLRCNVEGHLCNGKRPESKPFTAELASCTSNPEGRLIPVKTFTQDILNLKKENPERIIVSAITGMPNNAAGAKYAFTNSMVNGSNVLDIEPICTTAKDGTAAPSIRLTEFVKAFGANGTLDSICNDDFSPALKRIAELIAARIDPGCIAERVLDTDINTPGLQPECSVIDRIPGTPNNVDTVVPACGKGAVFPCWQLLEQGNAENKCTAPQLRVKVDRNGKEAAKGTIQLVKCRTCVGVNPDDKRCN